MIIAAKCKSSMFIFCLLSLFIASNSFSQINDSLIVRYNYINSIPQNAEVYYNDSLLGSTPLRTFYKLSYPGFITIKYKGYKDYVYGIQQSDSLLNLTFNLSPDLKNLHNRGEQLVTENKGSLFKKPRKIIPIAALGTVTLGSAVSAYYFKNLANDRYSEYLKNGEQKLLDETKKYDLISGISLAVFQLGLLAVVYFLFID